MHDPNNAHREASNYFQSCAAWARRKKKKKDSRELSEHRKVRHGTMCLAPSGPIKLTSQTCRGYDRVSWWAKWHAPTCPLLPFSPTSSPYRYPLHLSLPPLRGAHFPPPRSNRPPLDTLSR